MQLSTTLSTTALAHRETAVRPRAAGRTDRPGLAARGATLARMLLVPGAAEEALREIGDVPGAAPRDAA